MYLDCPAQILAILDIIICEVEAGMYKLDFVKGLKIMPQPLFCPAFIDLSKSGCCAADKGMYSEYIHKNADLSCSASNAFGLMKVGNGSSEDEAVALVPSQVKLAYEKVGYKKSKT